ncbi:hypothetical protein BGZ58_007291 [Dissophora ornata]|nr:hypothetical protein BGZ58_007291 [Dissophora ornata]
MVNALQESTQDQKAQQQQQQTTFDAPYVATDEQVALAKQGIKEILSQMPVERVEPLFDTMDGYCRAFSSLCSLACDERRQSMMIVDTETRDDKNKNKEDGEEIEDDKEETVKGAGMCANTEARSVALAGASCQCARFDLTNRVNFAIIGGVVSSKKALTSDFTAEGLLDGITVLPKPSVFMTIIHVVQSVCGVVCRITSLANPSPSQHAESTGGILGGIAKMAPGLANLVPGLVSLVPGGGIVAGLLPMIGGLFGGGDKTAPHVDNNSRSEEVKDDVHLPPTTTTATKTTAATEATKTESTATSTTTAAKSSGSIFGWFTHLFEGTDGQEQVINGSTQEGELKLEQQGEDEETNRLVSRDGKIAKITRVQRRQAKNMVASQQSKKSKVDL